MTYNERAAFNDGWDAYMRLRASDPHSSRDAAKVLKATDPNGVRRQIVPSER